MKLLLSICILLTSSVFAQKNTSIFLDVCPTISSNIDGEGRYGGTFGLNFTYKSLFLRAGYDLGFGGNFKTPDNTVTTSLSSFKLGYTTNASEKVRVYIYSGIANFKGIKTSTTPETISGGINTLLGEDLIDTRYLSYRFSNMCVPFGVDFRYGSKKATLIFGFYGFISDRYNEGGIKIGAGFGS